MMPEGGSRVSQRPIDSRVTPSRRDIDSCVSSSRIRNSRMALDSFGLGFDGFLVEVFFLIW
jgi:hypothetical protein